jgi:hypothetical protein
MDGDGKVPAESIVAARIQLPTLKVLGLHVDPYPIPHHPQVGVERIDPRKPMVWKGLRGLPIQATFKASQIQIRWEPSVKGE